MLVDRVLGAYVLGEDDLEHLRVWVDWAVDLARHRGGRLQWVERLVGVDRHPSFVLFGKLVSHADPRDQVVSAAPT